MNTTDTICAPATAIGGAIAVIRIAGPDAWPMLQKVWQGGMPPGPTCPRRMVLGRVGGDQVLGVFMPGPHSYTGDDVAELHCHGGARAAHAVLAAVREAGCRMAEPGEFTFRAFANGKIDLVQAEAVGDLVAAQSDMALHLAERQLAGALSGELGRLRGELVEILAECESHLDFPDEELDWDNALAVRLEPLCARLETLTRSGRAGALLREGVRLVIAGRPNAGKSSLLNRLLGYERAIVTDIAGTTRDTLEERTEIRGIPVRLIDTAGLREGGDVIERIGMERSRESLRTAEVVFWVLDAAADPQAEAAEMAAAAPPCTVAVWNKMDVAPEVGLPQVAFPTVRISAVTGAGLEELADTFAAMVWQEKDWREPEIAVNARHQEQLHRASTVLPEAAKLINAGEWELAAIPLRAAIEAIGRITGETTDPDVLENIFSRFCIGK